MQWNKKTYVELGRRFLQEFLERNKVLPSHLADLVPVGDFEEDTVLLAADFAEIRFGCDGGNEVDFGEVAERRSSESAQAPRRVWAEANEENKEEDGVTKGKEGCGWGKG